MGIKYCLKLGFNILSNTFKVVQIVSQVHVHIVVVEFLEVLV